MPAARRQAVLQQCCAACKPSSSCACITKSVVLSVSPAARHTHSPLSGSSAPGGGQGGRVPCRSGGDPRRPRARGGCAPALCCHQQAHPGPAAGRGPDPGCRALQAGRVWRAGGGAAGGRAAALQGAVQPAAHRADRAVPDLGGQQVGAAGWKLGRLHSGVRRIERAVHTPPADVYALAQWPVPALTRLPGCRTAPWAAPSCMRRPVPPPVCCP